MEIISNMIPHLQAWWGPAKTLGLLLGIALVVAGTVSAGNARQYSFGQSRGIGGAMIMIIAGFFLTNISASMDVFAWTAFRSSVPDVLSYVPPNAAAPEGVMIQFAVYVVNLVGLIGFIRGFWLLTSGHGAGGFGSAATHIIGGTFAMNIVDFAQMVGLSLGNPVQSTIILFLGS